MSRVWSIHNQYGYGKDILYPQRSDYILTETILIGDIYLIGVGSAVVCSTLIGSARASTRGTDNQKVPRFFYAK